MCTSNDITSHGTSLVISRLWGEGQLWYVLNTMLVFGESLSPEDARV